MPAQKSELSLSSLSLSLVHVFVSTVQAPRLQDGQQIFEVDDDGGDVVAVRPLLHCG